MLRPRSTRWLEVLCPRTESVRTLAELARTGAVELERRDADPGDAPLRHLATELAAYADLLPRYGRYWARGRWRHSPLVEPPEVVLERALARIAAWRLEADPLIDAIQACEQEMQQLRWLEQIVATLIGRPLDFAAVASSGPVLGTFCAILPRMVDPPLPAWAIARPIPWQDERCFMILGPRDRLDLLKRQFQSVKGRIVERPAWLRGDARDSLARIGERRAVLARRVVYLYASLDTCFDDYDLADVLGEVAGLSWFAEHVGTLDRASEHLVWITGWTDDLRGTRVAAALAQARTHALLRLGRPPEGKRAPQILDNPPWARPFELFVRAFGVPGPDEADPTPILALTVPLLFGYMFADLGQGAVLLALGIWLQRRWAVARLLVLGGGTAMGFGVLFGSVFGREDLLPALWLHPLEAPVTVLLVPLVFAVALLSLGQLLASLGALWRGDLSGWLRQDLGLLLLYLGSIGWFWTPALGWLAGLGLVWILGGAYLFRGRPFDALVALGRLLESGLQLLVNTLSFARVGAFALAHASLCAAIVAIADVLPSPAAVLVMIAGNLSIIALEGLVVSIQATRLVLFEFFNRFLRGSGRVFSPLSAPPRLVQGNG